MAELEKAKISVIMPNYNCEQYVGYAIQSVLDQTYGNFELIIVDDCSTDRSREVIDSFHDTRIKKVFFEQNELMYYAYNYAISLAEGEYYAVLDSDDYWHPDKLIRQLEYMENHLECGACFTLVNVVDEDDNILTEIDSDRVKVFEVHNMTQAEWIRYFYFCGSCLCHSSVLMRRETINKVGVYNYSLVQNADFELWTRIAKEYDIYVIQERLINYRWFKSGKNFSAPSKEVLTRSNIEVVYVLSKYFEDISDELFVEAFSVKFVNKNARTHEELLCEKALMLLQSAYCGYSGKIGGIINLAKLIQRDCTRNILREKYGITQKSIYEFTKSPILYDDDTAAKIERCDEQQEYIQCLEEGRQRQQEYVYNLEHDIEEQKKYIQQIDEVRNNQQEYIGNLEKDIENQKAYIELIEGIRRERQEHIDYLNEKLTLQNDSISNLEKDIENQQEYIESLEKELKNQKEYIQTVDRIKSEQREQIDNFSEELAVQNNYISHLESLIEKYIDGHGQHGR